jgi:hypothetical protein
MKKLLIASVIIIGFAGPALAAAEFSPQASAKHFAVKHTVGVCSVVDVKPSGASNFEFSVIRVAILLRRMPQTL